MPCPRTTRSTALALLALMGLVGVLGAGLHSLVHLISGEVDCWRYGVAACCGLEFSAASNRESDSQDAGKSAEKLAADRHADCPICTLLARYHAPPAARSSVATLALLHADVTAVVSPILTRATPRAHRPRGPPAWN